MVEVDVVVHAAGRATDFDALDLSAAGVASDNGRLRRNEFLQSATNARVYAAGDAAQNGPPLTPVDSHDAKVVAANLLGGNHHKANYEGVPSVAFTIPQLRPSASAKPRRGNKASSCACRPRELPLGSRRASKQSRSTATRS